MDAYINYYAVGAAALANMVIGFLWYGPVFGNHWKKLMGLTDETMKSMPLTPIQAMLGGLVMSILMAIVLAHSVTFGSAYLKIAGLSAGLQAGFWNWLGFALTITAGSFLWEGRPLKLWVLNATYYLVSFLVMGTILALWS